MSDNVLFALCLSCKRDVNGGFFLVASSILTLIFCALLALCACINSLLACAFSIKRRALKTDSDIFSTSNLFSVALNESVPDL